MMLKEVANINSLKIFLITIHKQEGPQTLGYSPKYNIYKGIGKQSSPLRSAMHFVRSAVPLRLYMEKFPFNILTKLA